MAGGTLLGLLALNLASRNRGTSVLPRTCAATASTAPVSGPVDRILEASRAGDWQRCVALLDEARAQHGSRLLARSLHATSLACSRAGEWAVAERLLLELVDTTGLAPRADAYNGAIRAASRAGDPKGASRLLQQMSDAGVEPDAVSYSCAVHPRSLPPRFRRMRHRTNRAAGKKRKKRNRPNCSQQSPRPQVRARRPDLRPTGRPRAHAVDA